MAQKNFEIKLNPTHVLLRVSPGEEGRKAAISEIQSELNRWGISYRPEHLFDIYRRASNQFESLTTRETTQYEVYVEVNGDATEAYMTIIPPAKGVDVLNPNKVKEAIKAANVHAGLLYDEIQKAVVQRIENKPVLIARGKPVSHGTDGAIEFLQEQQAAPDLTSQSVDLKEMNRVKSVAEGDVIAHITQPVPGINGFDIRGHVVEARVGRKALYRLGHKVQLNETGDAIVAMAPGYVVVEGDKLSVEEVFRANDGVGGATGNIRFAGVVYVNGNVEDGFEVEGTQGIDVTGVVGKASLKSSGNIVIRGGVMGGKIETDGSVEAMFISDGQVRAGGDVTAVEYILNSDVQAGRMVRVAKPPDGFINGGVTKAGDLIWAPNLGSPKAELITDIQVGMGLSLQQQFDNLEIALERNRITFDKLSKNLFVLEKQKAAKGDLGPGESNFNKMVEAALNARDVVLKGMLEHQQLLGRVSQGGDEHAMIFVSNTVNSGVHITIRRNKVNIATPMVECAFRVERGALKPHDFNPTLALYKALNNNKLPFKI